MIIKPEGEKVIRGDICAGNEACPEGQVCLPDVAGDYSSCVNLPDDVWLTYEQYRIINSLKQACDTLGTKCYFNFPILEHQLASGDHWYNLALAMSEGHTSTVALNPKAKKKYEEFYEAYPLLNPPPKPKAKTDAMDAFYEEQAKDDEMMRNVLIIGAAVGAIWWFGFRDADAS